MSAFLKTMLPLHSAKVNNIFATLRSILPSSTTNTCGFSLTSFTPAFSASPVDDDEFIKKHTLTGFGFCLFSSTLPYNKLQTN